MISSGTQFNNLPISLQPMITWVDEKYEDPKAVKLGKYAYGFSLFSCIFMALLGRDFIKHAEWPDSIAVVFGILSSIPLTLLISNNAYKLTKDHFTVAPDSFKQITVELKTNRKKQIINLIRKSFTYGLSTLPAFCFTFISHKKVLEVGNQYLAWITDFPAFFPRMLLFKSSIHTCVEEMINLPFFFSNINRLSDVDQKRSLLKKHLMKVCNLLQQIDEEKIIELKNSITDIKPLNIQHLIELNSLPYQYPEKNSNLNIRGRWLIIILGLCISFMASYTLKPVGDLAYASFASSSSAISLLSWLSVGVFFTLTMTGQKIAFTNFYTAGYRIKGNLEINSEQHLSQSSSLFSGSSKHNILKESGVLIGGTILSVLSIIPRLEINIEVYKNLPKGITTLLDIGTGISFFSLDFWPLNELIQKCLKINNSRSDLLNITKKLLEILPVLKDEYILELYSNLKMSQTYASSNANIRTPLMQQQVHIVND